MIGLLVMNQLIKGCDASIMLINPDGDDEWRSLDGITLKPEGFNTVMSAKAAVDSDPQCRNMVSCADILALAARDAVFLVSRAAQHHSTVRSVTVPRVNTHTHTHTAVQSGGPDYQVELGRYDGRVSTEASVLIPHGSFDLDQLNRFFSGLGLSQADMIALSGS